MINIKKSVMEESMALRRVIESLNGESNYNVTNPIFAYEGCMNGQIEELVKVLNSDHKDKNYKFFMRLKPLEAACFAYLESNINIAALKELISHYKVQTINISQGDILRTQLNNEKLSILSRLWQNLDNAIVDGNFNKMKKIIVVFTLIRDEHYFLEELQNRTAISESLIDNKILERTVDNHLTFLSSFRSSMENLSRVNRFRSAPSC